MMIGGRKRLFYYDGILVRIEPGMREAVAAEAARENTTISEIIRRGVRAAITRPSDSAFDHAAGGTR